MEGKREALPVRDDCGRVQFCLLYPDPLYVNLKIVFFRSDTESANNELFECVEFFPNSVTSMRELVEKSVEESIIVYMKDFFGFNINCNYVNHPTNPGFVDKIYPLCFDTDSDPRFNSVENLAYVVYINNPEGTGRTIDESNFFSIRICDLFSQIDNDNRLSGFSSQCADFVRALKVEMEKKPFGSLGSLYRKCG